MLDTTHPDTEAPKPRGAKVAAKPCVRIMAVAREIAAYEQLPPATVAAAFARQHRKAGRGKARSTAYRAARLAQLLRSQTVWAGEPHILDVAADAVALDAAARSLSRARQSGKNDAKARRRLYEILLPYGLSLEPRPRRAGEVWAGKWPYHGDFGGFCLTLGE